MKQWPIWFLVLAVTALSSDSAFAVEWSVNGKPPKPDEAVDSMAIVDDFIIEDQTLGVSAECVESGTAVINPGALGSMTTYLLTDCGFLKKGLCEGNFITVVALGLPWNLELVKLKNGEFRDRIKNSGAGPPGFDASCIFAKQLFSDPCTGETTTAMLNNPLLAGVEAAFDSATENLNCKFGKGGDGDVDSVELMKTRLGGVLSVS